MGGWNWEKFQNEGTLLEIIEKRAARNSIRIVEPCGLLQLPLHHKQNTFLKGLVLGDFSTLVFHQKIYSTKSPV
jgi:hypothetical protein